MKPEQQRERRELLDAWRKVHSDRLVFKLLPNMSNEQMAELERRQLAEREARQTLKR